MLDILEENGLLGSKQVETPVDPNVKFYEDQIYYLILRDIVVWLVN